MTTKTSTKAKRSWYSNNSHTKKEAAAAITRIDKAYKIFPLSNLFFCNQIKEIHCEMQQQLAGNNRNNKIQQQQCKQANEPDAATAATIAIDLTELVNGAE